MTSALTCKRCATTIHPQTAERWGGLCVPCFRLTDADWLARQHEQKLQLEQQVRRLNEVLKAPSVRWFLTCAEAVDIVLARVQSYMNLSKESNAADAPTPLRFWEWSDDDAFFEALQVLPYFTRFEWSRIGKKLPTAFHLASSVFALEDDFLGEGWDGLGNARRVGVANARKAFRVMGMHSEANALDAAYAQYQRTPNDHDAIRSAYASVPNEFSDDLTKHQAIIAFFRRNSSLWECQSKSSAIQQRGAA